MKKVFNILIVLGIIILCIGCKNDATNKQFDKNYAKEEIGKLSLDGFKFSDEANVNNKSAIEVYGVDLTKTKDYLFYMSSEVVNPSMYLIVSVDEENKAVLKYQINDMFDKYYSAYNNYYPKEAKMIKDRLETEYSDYLIYIISSDNNSVLQVIKDSFK